MTHIASTKVFFFHTFLNKGNYRNKPCSIVYVPSCRQHRKGAFCGVLQVVKWNHAHAHFSYQREILKQLVEFYGYYKGVTHNHKKNSFDTFAQQPHVELDQHSKCLFNSVNSKTMGLEQILAVFPLFVTPIPPPTLGVLLSLVIRDCNYILHQK